MAQSLMSLLLLRRLTLTFRILKSSRVSYLLSLKPYSTTASPTSSPDSPKVNSISPRMSFIFDQIDAIQRDRSENNTTLQRIRSWRQTRVPPRARPQQNPEPTQESIQTQNPEEKASQDGKLEPRPRLAEPWSDGSEVKKVELEHPWPEWLELMERLVQQNYFDHKRKDKDQSLESSGLDVIGGAIEDGSGDGGFAKFDFKNFKTVDTACVSFGKDRFDIMRSLSRQDIKVLVGDGCANSVNKVVFSSKLLRKHARLDEGDVCSNCSLRSTCERAYLITNKEDEARTIDVMRVLVAYGFDPIKGSVTNKSLMQQKSVKTVVRKLIHLVVKLSAVPIDPNLPPPVIVKPPPKVKQPPPPPRKRVGRYDVEMKKGDWLCTKCDFMNFAKNAVCLQCDAKQPKRQLLPGEWVCPECNFLNYRRNMTCFHCDCKRPADWFVEDKMEQKQHGHGKVLEKARQIEVPDAWNFDFDDNASDGADIAAFEYADSEARSDDSHLASQAGEQSYSRCDDGFSGASRMSRVHDREYPYPNPNPNPNHYRFGRGFDDFDDEDDFDSYEVDSENNSPALRTSSKKISVVDNSGSEDIEDFDSNMHARGRSGFSSHAKPSNPKRKKSAFSDYEDELGAYSKEGISTHPKWKYSHVADARHRGRGRRPTSFGSDEELDSDIENETDSSHGKRRKWVSGRRNHKNSYSEDLFSGSEDESNDRRSWGRRSEGNIMKHKRRSDNFRGRGDYEFVRDSGVRSKAKMGDRPGGSYGKNRGLRGDDNAGQRRHTGGDDWNNKGVKREGLHRRQGIKSREFNMDMDFDHGELRNSRRVIER